jgi:ectoine hydroxylase-related dioxygenase (phytanoyl-CoA dioxygenase family)
MEEFTESSDLLDRPAELAARLADDGYVFFRGLLDRDRVLDVRRQVLDALAGQGWLAEGSDPADALPGELIRREADENWWEGYTALQSVEAFHRLAHDERIVSTVRSLLGGDDVLVHPRKIGRVSYPGSALRTPPHQDFPFIQGTPDVLTTWVPFGDYPLEMGPLRVLEGSHRIGLQEHGPTTGIGGLGVIDPDLDDSRWRSTEYRAGDVLLFFSLTVHYAPPNEGERLRLSADYRYQSAREPLVDGSLHPHMVPSVPAWDALTVGWSTTAWIDAPDQLPVVEVRTPDRTLTAGSSRFV